MCGDSGEEKMNPLGSQVGSRRASRPAAHRQIRSRLPEDCWFRGRWTEKSVGVLRDAGERFLGRTAGDISSVGLRREGLR